MRRAQLVFIPLGALALLAAVTFINTAWLLVNASLPPVSKNLNVSLRPLADAWWAAAGDYNVTYYRVKFMPGWPELYTVGVFAPRDPGWEARLEKLAQTGTGQYAIALGGEMQITESQNAGPYVPVVADTTLDWQILATQRLSILARAWFLQGGVTAVQLVNFTAEPMAKLYQQTFYCGVSQYFDGFNYCSRYVMGFDDGTLRFITTGQGSAYIDTRSGNPPPSVYAEGKNGYGGAFLNLSSWVGGLPATGSFAIDYFLQAAITGTDYLQLNFFVDTNNDGRPDVEVVYYISVNGRNPLCLSSIIYGYGASCIPMLYSSSSPPQRLWLTWVVSKIYDYGVVVGVAFGAYSPNGNTRSLWDNLAVTKCVLPPNVDTYVRGQQYTQVYIDPNISPTSPPSLATEVDAYGVADWGAAVAVFRLPSSIPAYGTVISAWGRYLENVDTRNNVAYLSIGVDADGDGHVDKEYIIYRHDTAGGTGVIISAFFDDPVTGNPKVVCTVDSAGVCTPADLRFVVVNAGSMTSGNNYQWSYALYERGAVLAVALAAVDASGYASGTADDFWVYWDDLSIQYSACPPPGGWTVSGRYVWQSYDYLLVSGSATVYRPLVANALTYVSNFTGVGVYAVFDSGLDVVFGVRVDGGSFVALCGGSAVPLGALPGARFVELRPLNGFGDVIIRDKYGAVLARYGCHHAATPQYVGYKAGLLRVYNITAFG